MCIAKLIIYSIMKHHHFFWWWCCCIFDKTRLALLQISIISTTRVFTEMACVFTGSLLIFIQRLFSFWGIPNFYKRSKAQHKQFLERDAGVIHAPHLSNHGHEGEAGLRRRVCAVKLLICTYLISQIKYRGAHDIEALQRGFRSISSDWSGWLPQRKC